ncbi:MAG: DnaJ domain-containing protein [Spirochaetota bacterium]
MASFFYYQVLGVRPGETPDRIKKAYYRLVRDNHPDRFPEEMKELQRLKLIRIIDAYKAVTAPGGGPRAGAMPRGEGGTESTGRDGAGRGPHAGEPAEANQVGSHRDIQYAYYKQGFLHYSRALCGISSIERDVRRRNDLYYLRRFSSALVSLRRADHYFSTLVDRYPDSIWSHDALVKIRRAAFFHGLYRKILLNIEQHLREQGAPVPRE